MDFILNDLLEQHVRVLVIATFFGLIFSLLAWKLGYYCAVRSSSNKIQQVKGEHVLVAFGLFFIVEAIVVPSLYLFWLSFERGEWVISLAHTPDGSMQGWLNLLGILCAAVVLALFCRNLNSDERHMIWGNHHSDSKRWQFAIDLCLGAVTWIIVYPWIVVNVQVIDIVLELGNNSTQVEQVAVKHVKDALSNPALLWTTMIAVVTIVPCLEELLFRGFLQTWLKGYFGRSVAIGITAAVFACFHYSSRQGMENVELLLSLFILACYLGFLRERQNSIWASMGLHAAFNGVSLLMIVVGGF